MAAISNNLLSKRFYQKIHDTLPVLLFWTDTNDIILGNNLPHAKAFGFSSSEELIGKSLDYFLKNSPVFSPELADRIRKEHQEIIQTKKGKILEYTAILADGKEHTHLSYKEPLFNEEGNIIGLIGISTDITELKRAQLELRQAKQNARCIFQNIIDLLPALLFWTDKENKYLGNNSMHAKAFGFLSSDQLIGKSVRYSLENVHLDKELIDRVDKEHSEIMQTKQGKVLEYTASLADKVNRTWLSHKEPLLDQDDNAIGIIGISMDITELKETQEKLEISNAVKKEFIANMSHDMRTPITGVMGMLKELLMLSDTAESALAESPNLPVDDKTKLLKKLIDRIDENSSVALEATDSLLQMCNEILEVARLESHTAKVPLEAFELKTSVQEIITLLKPAAKDRRLILKATVDSTIPKYLYGSQRYLSKTLLNLISNAIKFTDKGSVTLTLALENPSAKAFKKGDSITLKIIIADTGIGIPKDKFETIFEHFSRLTPAYEGVYKGSGLGLYTVKQYVEAMEGTITVESVVGKGSSFTILLPFTVDDHTDQINTPKKTPVVKKRRVKSIDEITDEQQNLDNTRVLLVEDDRVAGMAAKATLRICGCCSQIDVAPSGEDALQKATENLYDLILMDIGLPKMKGTEVTRKIRALTDPVKSQVPIVALSGHIEEENREEFLALGMNDLLLKPASNAEMTAILEEYVFPKTDVDQDTKPISHEQKIQPSISTDYPVLDWDAGVKSDVCRGNENTLLELLTLLSKELKPSKKLLKKAYTKKDIQRLRAELHKLRGALSYVPVPELAQTMKMFHEAVRAEPQNPEYLEKTYHAAIAAIDNFQEVAAKGFQPKEKK